MTMQLSLRVPLALQNNSRRAILYMIFSSLCFAAVELAGNFYVRNVTAPQLVWSRYAVHLLFMLAVLGPRFKTRLYKTSRLKLQIVRSLTMVAMPLCFILAATHMPTNDVWSVYWLSPAMMLVLSTLVLHEPVGNTRWIVCAIGFVGALLVYRPDGGILNPYSIFAFGCGLAIALHLMLSRILREDHPILSLFHTALWAFLVFSFFLPFLWKTPALTDLIGIVLVGLIGMVALYTLALSGELVPLSVVAIFSYTELIWDLLLKGLFFGVVPGKSELLGALLITVVTGFLLYREFNHPYVEIKPVVEPI
jgi:drug/metabolite transporter (DMT)-like permease